MDPITLIVTALAAGSSKGALEALEDDVKDAIKAAYATLRGLVRSRVGDQPGAELVLAQYEDDPGTWETPLAKMLQDTGAAVDANLLAVAHALLELADAVGAAEGKYDVTMGSNPARLDIPGRPGRRPQRPGQRVRCLRSRVTVRRRARR